MVVLYIQIKQKDTVKARSRKTMIKLKKKVEFYPSIDFLSLFDSTEREKNRIIRFHKYKE